MAILRIEHTVPDFAAWKRAFDSDPAGRKQCGVRRYGALRPIDDPNYVLVDLEFDTTTEAEAFGRKLRELRGRVEGTVMTSPRARILEALESKEYQGVRPAW